MHRIQALNEINAKLRTGITNIINIAEDTDDEKVFLFKTAQGDMEIDEADLIDKNKFDAAFADSTGRLPATVSASEWADIIELINKFVSAEDEDAEEIFKSFKYTDMGNAEAFAVTIVGKLLYLPEEKRYFVYESDRWKPDLSGKLIHKFKVWSRRMDLKAFELKDSDKRSALQKHFIKNETHARVKALEALVRTEPGMTKSISEFDTDPGLLNVKNGVLDLYSQDILPHRADQFLTKITSVEYRPGAKAPAFTKFIEQVTDKNKELQLYIQKAVGYALTGSIEEQCLFILYGTGANGKSTFVETIKALFSEYAVTIPVEALLSRTTGMASEIVRLRGARLAITGEPERGAKLSEGLIKILTGGDTVTGRGLYRDSEEFTNNAKIMLVTNHLPQIAGTDEGIWRRIRVVPFTVTIPEGKRDKKLLAKLKAELPGILNWALEGLALWFKEGMESPQVVKQYTKQYRDDQDVLQDFLDEYTVTDPRGKYNSGKLFDFYVLWCHTNNEKGLSRKDFGDALEGRGFTRGRNKRERYFVGLTEIEGVHVEKIR